MVDPRTAAIDLSMIVCILDRTLKLLNIHTDKSAAIATYLDWSVAFDGQEPTQAIQKFIQLGVSPSLSLIPQLIS